MTGPHCRRFTQHFNASRKPGCYRSSHAAVLLVSALIAACGGPDAEALFDPTPTGVATAGAPTALAATGGSVTAMPQSSALVALLDDVVIGEPGGAQARAWRFDSDADVADMDQSVFGKWARTAFSPIGTAPGARDSFSTDEGGCLENDAPFSGPSQYYEVSVLFTAADYAKHHISARIELVSGGMPDATCPAQAELFVVAPVPPLYPMAEGASVTLHTGAWQMLNLDVPDATVAAASSDTVSSGSPIDQLGLRITTYPCE